MKLKNNQEVRGVLDGIAQSEHQVLLRFTFTKEIVIPANAVDIQLLQRLIGVKIGLIFIDGNYKIRECQRGKTL